MKYTKPVISNFYHIAPLMIQRYERYLPTAFDESLTMLEKVNKIIEHLNQVGELSNEIVDKWNEVMEWIMTDGISDAVKVRLDKMIEDGVFDTIINEDVLNRKATVIVSKEKPTNITINDTTFWYKEVEG